MQSNHLDTTLVSNAVESILDFEAKELIKTNSKAKLTLITNYAKPILAQIQLTRSIEQPVQRPVRVKIPNSIFHRELEDHNICLFVKADDLSEIETCLVKYPIDGLTKVLSLTQVIKLYRSFKDRKELLKEFTHFLCDSSIMSHLYNSLGGVFAAKNNFPIPIDIPAVPKLSASISKAVNSTYMHLKGQNITIRMGYTSMGANEIAENIISGLEFAVAKIPGGEWTRIHSIHLKSSSSPAIPVYGKGTNEAIEFIKKQINDAENLNSKKRTIEPPADEKKKIKKSKISETIEGKQSLKKIPKK